MFAWMYTSIDPTAENYDYAMEVKDWWFEHTGLASTVSDLHTNLDRFQTFYC